MKDKQFCDIFVIGSGLGGLTTAALLAKDGYRVIVAEKMPRIGGRCSTIEYKGFKSITGVVGIEMNGVVETLFKRLGAEFDVRPAGAPHYLIKGKICQVPSHGGMKHLMIEAGGDLAEVEKVMNAMTGALQWRTPSSHVTLYHWIRQYTKNQAIMDVFRTLISAVLFVNVNEISVRTYFEFIRELKGIPSFGYAPKGSITLAESLSRVIHDHGGEIWINCQVTRIDSQNSIVREVSLLRRGQKISMKVPVVISNAAPRETAKLASIQNLDKYYAEELEQRLIPVPITTLQFSMDKPLFNNNHLLISGTKNLNAIYQPSIVCPEWAPVGKHFLVAGSSPRDSSAPFDGKKEIENCFNDLREIFPDFDNQAELLLAGTFHGSWPGMHSWPGRDMDRKTPVINLYNVGDGVKFPGYTGLPGVVKTGIDVAEEIMGRNRILTGSL